MESKPKMGRPRKLPKLDSARVFHVAVTTEQLEWITAEWRRRELETRVDVLRALIRDAMARPKKGSPK